MARTTAGDKGLASIRVPKGGEGEDCPRQTQEKMRVKMEKKKKKMPDGECSGDVLGQDRIVDGQKRQTDRQANRRTDGQTDRRTDATAIARKQQSDCDAPIAAAGESHPRRTPNFGCPDKQF